MRSRTRRPRAPGYPPAMATAADHLSDPELLETGWDLRPLLDGEPADGSDDPEDRARRLLDEATGLAEGFAAHYAGKVADLDADGLRDAMHQLERINELVGRAGSYAS